MVFTLEWGYSGTISVVEISRNNCGGVAGPSYEQEAPLRPKHKRHLCGPALRHECCCSRARVVDEEKPEPQSRVFPNEIMTNAEGEMRL
jgi:hypothetical protein